MAGLAVDGITSMSIRPIRMITALGFLVSMLSALMIIVCLVDWMIGKNVPGYTTMIVVSCLIGGLTIFYGYRRRVCGKNLSGNEGAAKIYCGCGDMER